MRQEKKEQMIDGGLRINVSADEFVHSISQQQRADKYD